MNIVYLLTGANIGNPRQQLNDAKIEIAERVGKIIKESSIYESEAWGVEDQPIFLNQVLEVITTHSASKVLQTIQQIELVLGRIRTQRWGSRTIDIDILYYNTDIIHEPDLQVPHPYIQERNFTLIPLTEIAPNFEHPIFKKTNQQLLMDSKDPLNVNIAKHE
ncbi:2-amino-4-hydroxy-6-hydroxymethyldihydropteridine diphosphokinase [Sphingobacterium hotanense]|uniref:2-amino-4-hydroxy-6-hydroxymethyldihydropteridine pyrophosphokinase n=1 Tax=Sphingobacterium hotanense TaxID=649196 RepID=A0ABT7NSP7_9SPHI|nr:2-amino-4-hydroxy-6-hydroxymethyldihydropteridine diphosphokinase [Sphingobacterium hotanense]MDM1050279.1 2-amino-4-hydroxy-6-hydroxymethyldihydropteridine diphosphokinase [Sphingobacterium hotanense]